MEIRIHFQEELDSMLNEIMNIAIRVEEAVTKALLALERHDKQLAQEVIDKDEYIDQLRTKIENKCITLIAKEQPVAQDLRTIVTTIKVVSHIERIGDHARHLARAVSQIPDAVIVKAFPRIKEMAGIGLSMLRESVTAFIESDAEKPTNIIARDEEIDRLHLELYHDIIRLMKNDPEIIESATSLLFLNRFMERMGDHVTKICEWVYYSSTGKHLNQ